MVIWLSKRYSSFNCVNIPSSGARLVRLFPERSKSSRWRSFEISGGTDDRALWLRYRLIRNLKEKSPEVEGIFLMLTPPMSNEFQVFSGERIAVGRGATGATVEEGWSTTLTGDASEASDVSGSFVEPLVCGGGLTRFGLVIGMADLVTVREAMALARARWCGERDERIIC